MKIDQDLFDLEDEGISSENDQEEDDFDLTHFCLIKFVFIYLQNQFLEFFDF